MECPQLKLIVDLIKSHTKYDSNTSVAKRVGIAESTLRGYWDRDKVEKATIPNKKIDAFCDLLIEIVPRPISKDTAKQLLQNNAILFHNTLLPIGGHTWQKLIDDFKANSNIEVLIRPEINLGFGESDDEDSISPDAIVPFNQPFCFTGNAPWQGEAVIIAEHLGQWHICMVAQQQRIVPIEFGLFFMPPQSMSPLREKTKTGIYRYFIVIVKSSMSALLREQLHTTNPPEQSRLNMLADLFMNNGKENCIVWSTTINVKKRNEDY